MNYDDNAGHLHVHLKPGLQHLNGREALGFVRYRKSNARGLGDGDVGRAGRQQQFLKAMAEQHVQAASLPGLLAAAKEVSRHLETDMPAADLADLVRTLRACEPGDILTATVPLRSSGRHHGAYYAYADEGRLRRVLAQIDRHLDQGSARGPTVRVLNASGRAGQAAEVSRVLARKGFVTLAPGNAERSDLERTVIEYRPGHESAARRAARALRCGRLREAKEASGEAADLLVLVGRDFRP
jgi:anionic cell wall polymer biosynthesis LytR-Cps2A-Psr (LCP) family protein